MLQALGEAGTPCELYAVHGHYADAGEVAALMSSTLGVDMVMTGHSLGRNKLEHLLGALLPPLAPLATPPLSLS
jgi:sucrose-phosphate synthase